MKLADWAKKQGIAYLTAYRWFKDGKLPVEAYQSESGTIIVKDENLEQIMINQNSNTDQSSEVMSAFIKKTVEFSKNDSTIEEFAAYILSNFSLKFNNGQENPKYSKNKPKSEDIQRHFQQFINKKEKPKTNVFLEASENEMIDDLVAKADSLSAQELIDQIHEIGVQGSDSAPSAPELNDLLKALNPNALPNVPSPKVYGDTSSTEGLVSRTVDFNSTPQQINYTSSTDQTFGETLPLSNVNTVSMMSLTDGQVSVASTTNASGFLNFSPTAAAFVPTATASFYLQPSVTTATINNASTIGSLFPAASNFKPTQKELESANKLASTEPTAPRKRGRKPSKNKVEK